MSQAGVWGWAGPGIATTQPQETCYMLQMADRRIQSHYLLSTEVVYLNEPNRDFTMYNIHYTPNVYLHCFKSLLKRPQFAICNINNSDPFNILCWRSSVMSLLPPARQQRGGRVQVVSYVVQDVSTQCST